MWGKLSVEATVVEKVVWRVVEKVALTAASLGVEMACMWGHCSVEMMAAMRAALKVYLLVVSKADTMVASSAILTV